MGEGVLTEAELFDDLFVPLEQLDGVPALLGLRHRVDGRLLDVGQRVFHRPGEGVDGDFPARLGGPEGLFRRLHRLFPLEGGDFDDRAAELLGEGLNVDLVAVFADDVHHVDGDNHRDAQFEELGGEVEVPFEVRAIDDIQDCVRLFVDQVVPGDDLLQRVGGEGVDAGKVGDDDTVVLFQLPFLFLDGDARPVADELVGTSQGVKEGRFAGVGVAGQCNFHVHLHSSFRLTRANPAAVK